MPDWRQVTEVARRLGYGAAFPYTRPAEIFREHAALSAFENDGARAFDIGALADLSDAAYDALAPVQWPLPKGAAAGAKRLFSEGGFFHPDRRARLVAIEDPQLKAPPSTPFPFVLNTGRVRDHWHTMSRTALSPRLARNREAPFVEVHPDDADRLGLADGGFARVTTPQGRAQLRVVVTRSQQPGALFAPIHWTDATAAGARIGALTHAVVDPISGQPDSKASRASIAPCFVATEGFVVSRRRLDLPDWLAHARMTVKGGEAITFAAAEAPAALHAFLSNWLSLEAAPMMRGDERARLHQSASLDGERLDVLLWTGASLDRAALDWAIELIGRETIDPALRRFVLAGRPPGEIAAASPLVCSCFGVKRDAIESAIAKGCGGVEAIGRATRAGTNCGSCRAEIQQILASRAMSAS